MDSNIPAQSIQPNLPQQPQPPVKKSSKKMFWIFFITSILIAFLAGGYSLGTKQNNPSQQKTIISPTPSPTEASAKVGDPTADWKIYFSPTEKASFKYPQDWNVAVPVIKSNYPNADEVAFQSPNGEIKVSWVSALDGFGGACDAQVPLGQAGACQLFTLIDKTPISGAQDFYVVSGTLTTDGISFQPFLAVQDNGPWKLLGTQRTMGYDMFEGKNNGSLREANGNSTSALFSTSGAYGGGPSLTQAGAAAWFDKPEVQQAKLILLSLTY